VGFCGGGVTDFWNILSGGVKVGLSFCKDKSGRSNGSFVVIVKRVKLMLKEEVRDSIAYRPV